MTIPCKNQLFRCIFWMHCHIAELLRSHILTDVWISDASTKYVWALPLTEQYGTSCLCGNVHSGIIFTQHCHILNLLVPLAVILHIGKLHLHLGILAFCCLHKGQEFLTTQCTIPIDVSHLEQLFSSFDHEVLFNGGAVTKGKNSLSPTYTEEVVC